MLCARPISKPWCACLGPAVKNSGEGTSPNYPASVMVTGVTFGSTRVTDQPSAHSAATAASVGASSLTMPPSSMVPRHEAVLSSEREEKSVTLRME